MANQKGPDQVFGPKLADLFHEYARAIAKDSGASGVRIMAEFTFSPIGPRGKGNLSMKTFTTPDAKTERMLDPNTPLPRGSKLQHDALLKARSTLKRLKTLGG